MSTPAKEISQWARLAAAEIESPGGVGVHSPKAQMRYAQVIQAAIDAAIADRQGDTIVKTLASQQRFISQQQEEIRRLNERAGEVERNHQEHHAALYLRIRQGEDAAKEKDQEIERLIQGQYELVMQKDQRIAELERQLAMATGGPH